MASLTPGLRSERGIASLWGVAATSDTGILLANHFTDRIARFTDNGKIHSAWTAHNKKTPAEAGVS